jgi:hypothetical protein
MHTSAFTDALAALPWDYQLDAKLGVETWLRAMASDRRYLLQSIASLSPEQFRANADRSHETATHFKWLIHLDPDRRFSVWAHEYKTALLRRKAYAEVPHYHRYWFGSLVLRGSFDNYLYEIERDAQCEERLLSIKTTERHRLAAGDIYHMDQGVVHSLEGLEEGTLTLLVRSAALLPYSESFELDTLRTRKHIPFAERRADFQKLFGAV